MTRPVNFTNYEDKGLVASTVSSLWETYNNNRRGALKAWKELDQYRYATDTENLPGGDNFDHSMHTPITHMVDEKLGSILNATAFPHEDWLGWEATDLEGLNNQKRSRVLAYLKRVHAVTKFTRTGKKLLDDLRAYGNCFAQTVHRNDTSEEDGQLIPGFIGPDTKRISPYDIVFDPTANTFEDSFKIIRQRISVGEFLEFAEANADDINQDAVQDILERRIGAADSATSNDHYKNAQYTPQGFDSLTAYYRSGYVELLWYYGSIFDETSLKNIKNRCIVIADHNTLIMDVHKPNPRIRKGSWKERPDNLWAQGALEPIIGLNYMVNHRENAKNDAIDRMIHPDELYIGEPEVIHDDQTGRREIWAPVGGGAQDITPDSSTLSYQSEIDRIEQTVLQAVGLPPDVLGFRSPGEKTAFEVQNIVDGAFRNFIDHVAQWEQDCLEKVVADQLDVARENFVYAQELLTRNEDGFQLPDEITIEDLKTNAVLVPKGSRRFARMLQNLAGIQSMTQLQPVIGQHFDSFALGKAVESLSGLEDFGIVKKFGAIREQMDAEKEATLLEQDMVREMSQPTTIEEGL